MDFNPDLGFGRSAAVSGNRIVVGAKGYGIADGAANAYTYDPKRRPSWQGVQLLRGTPSLRDDGGNVTKLGDEVGYSVAAIGRAMIVGAPTIRSGYVQGGTDCHASNQVCVAGRCVAPVCQVGTGQCVDNVAQRCAENQLSLLAVDTCNSNEYCENGTGFWPLGCRTRACEPGTSACAREAAATCDADGGGLISSGADCRALRVPEH